MRVNSVQGLLGILIMGTVIACAAVAPDWIDGKSANYDDQAFLTGVGSDYIRSQAEDRARAELAKVFQVNIQAHDSISESSLVTKLSEASHEEYSQNAISKLETSTDKVLRGVQIVEFYNDEKTAKVYALAALDRVRASRELREELASIDTEVAHRVTMAEQSNVPPVRLGYYLQAVEANQRRSGVAADLRIADPAGWATPAKYRQGELVAAAERAATLIRVSIKMNGDARDIIEGAIVKALNDVGMKIVSSEANIVLTGRVDIEEYQREAMNWAVASAQVEFTLADGRRLDSLRTKAREGSQIKNIAVALAYERLGDKLAGFLLQRIGRMGR